VTVAVRVPLAALVTVTVVLVVEPLAVDSDMVLGEIVTWLEFVPVTVTVTVTEAEELSVPRMDTVWLYVPGASVVRL
jgi:hypothetical protein